MNNGRQSVPQDIADEVLFANDHQCCICRGRDHQVQLHHIDSRPSNNSPENLAVLCLNHHSRVTGDEGLGRRFTPGEVRLFKRSWEDYVAGLHDSGEDNRVDADGEVEDEVEYQDYWALSSDNEF